MKILRADDDPIILDMHIAKLRKRIEPDPAVPMLIETVRGVGYRFRAWPPK